jgi:hypothetical protein
MVTPEQRREIGGVALLAIALSFLLSLLPVGILGARGTAWFPGGNMMGPTGGAIRGFLWGVFGVSAFLTPALLAVLGLHAGDWLSRDRAIRWGILLAGLLTVGPVLLQVLGAESAAGWLGADVGGALLELLGPLGSLIVTSVGLVALSVGTLGWNPLRSLLHGMRAGVDVAGRTAKALADKGKELAEARIQRCGGVVVIGEAEAVEGMEPEWAAGEGEPVEDGVESEAATAAPGVDEPEAAHLAEAWDEEALEDEHEAD